MVSSWTAYGSPQYGANVASVDIIGGGVCEVATGPGPGTIYGPQVKAYSPVGTTIPKVNFFAYSTLRYGVQTAGGNVDGDSHEEILTSPGPGDVFGPHIRGWNYDGAGLAAMPKITFFAYSTLKWGARAAGGDIDSDAFAEILTGAGAGAEFGPHVRGFNYDNAGITTLPVSVFAFPERAPRRGRRGRRHRRGCDHGDHCIARAGPGIERRCEGVQLHGERCDERVDAQRLRRVGRCRSGCREHGRERCG